jgi:hypothetical protein
VLRWTLVVLVGIASPSVLVARTPNHPVPAGTTCPGDKVLWVHTRSHIHPFQGERYFGSTKEGKFICERDADKEGDRPTRDGQ